ncbi:zinc finger protein OZF [Tribolium castaneum]|uniref:PR domain zinc finger protein 5-like Protein n=1 Tax=Tribolium castaneum TaxID=7070 RepID=D2A438_TRICA|nr:PREDICTED: zinc finger protein OZF [Tribolium castaneum]XP_968144.1 PREDICTED: zinc finger protein OZF [Tribolium castaneum]EFA04847.1 PR domain zinc finger protein 5-like Protein [Tribolium castaneum]|eukprot:XP_008195002.1 PREDICTED: zinc finger protein OZF [Tribolium castaneum]
MSLTFTCNICVKFVASVAPVCGVGCNGTTYLTKLQAVVPEVEWSPNYRICRSCESELDAAYEFRERSIRLDFERQVMGPPETTRPIYPCYTCGELFVDGQQLSEHVDGHHPAVEDVEIISNQAQIWSEHMYAKQRIGGEDIACENCPQKFMTRKELEKHVPICAELKLKVGSCQVCGATGETTNDVVEHCINVHNLDKQEIKPFLCDKCPKRFARWYLLQGHQRQHSEKRDFVCMHCGRAFKTKIAVVHHEEGHVSVRNYKCELCNKTFKTKLSLCAHVRVVHFGREKDFACHLCKKRLLTKHSLGRHIRRHKGEKTFNCHLCSSSFFSQPELTNHVKRHAFLKEINPFKCQHCDKSYKLNVSYKLHLRRNHGIGDAKLPEKKHGCGVCAKKFHTKTHLKEHVRRHVGTNRHQCEVCGNKYSDKGALTSHRRNKHETEPPGINLL